MIVLRQQRGWKTAGQIDRNGYADALKKKRMGMMQMMNETELAVYDRQREEILDRLYVVEGKIDSIRLYLKNIFAEKHFSFGTWTSRQHVILAISACGKAGFAESILSTNAPDASLCPLSRLPWHFPLQTKTCLYSDKRISFSINRQTTPYRQ